MIRTSSLLSFGLALFLAGCRIPDGCPGNCEDVCGGKMFEANQCAIEYQDGYNAGFCAGVRNLDRRGDEQGTFVAGYWDGYSAGSILRLDKFIESCGG